MSGETDELCEMDVVELEKQESLFCFESMQDYNKLCFLMLSCTSIAVVLVWNSALTMCSGNYIFAKSQLDVLILSADILSIDLFSCAFVLCGYTASFVFVAVGSRQWQDLRSKLCWCCYSIGKLPTLTDFIARSPISSSGSAFCVFVAICMVLCSFN